jgi:predicted N-acyltransferase
MNMNNGCSAGHYVTRVVTDPDELPAQAWDALLAQHPGGLACGPFMRHAYLAALHRSGSAVSAMGWTPQWITLWRDGVLQAAAPLYLKSHSYGEYVFDWAWAQAYAEHGLAYYPKAVVAVPFTPVPGPRLLAVDAPTRAALVQALIGHCRSTGLSSLHLLFTDPADRAACTAAGLMVRQTVQFHWTQADPPDADFDAFLGRMTQDKRKKIRQERRKVEAAGVRFEHRRGQAITPEDWDFFYRCYARTYREHGNAPYLQPGFFEAMTGTLADHWLLFVARRADGHPIACSLVALSDTSAHPQAAYGRYWGALERVDCLHFEACYYQPLQWCLAHGVRRFEGGAQGEHKMARALLPVSTHSAHWLAHPAFAGAVDRFLQREGEGMAHYLAHLESRSPLRHPA